MSDLYPSVDWKDILQKLADIREREDYSPGNVDFIREQLQSADNRIRGGAALAAAGCVFEPYVLDLLLDMAETDSDAAIRRATILAMESVIREGVESGFENEIGPDTAMDNYEEWEDLQSQSLQEDYQRVKNFLLSIALDDFEEHGIRESALSSLSDLGFLIAIQEIITDFLAQEDHASQLAALRAMGKYPRFWIKSLARYIDLKIPKPLMLEAVSSSYASNSRLLAQKIEKLLSTEDPEILTFSLMTLTNINKTDNLGEILQKFALSKTESVSQTAKEALNLLAKANFSNFLQKELGLEE